MKAKLSIRERGLSYWQPGLFVVTTLANGESAATKAKNDESRSDDSDSDDDNMNKKQVVNGKAAKAAPVQKKDKSSDDDPEMRNPQLKLRRLTECNSHDW